MPPYKTGLLKRKISENTNKTKDNSSNSSSSCDDHNLIRGDLDKEADSSDSDNEDGHAPSDTELDGVVFDSGDSLLSDDAANESLEESSDVSDSEEDEASDGREKESDDDTSDSNTKATTHKYIQSNTNITKSKLKPDNEDSGAESGSGSASRVQHSLPHKNNEKPFKKKEFKQKATKVAAEKKKANSSLDALEQKIKDVQVNIQPVQEKDEYESGDTSDEEGRVNTAGEVPRWWYAEYDHVGYDADGRRIARPPHADRIDDFLRKCEDPDFWRTVRDPSTGQEIILSKKDLELISRIREGRVPNADHDEYQPWVEWFSSEVLATPLRAFPEHKRSFLPSRDEQLRVARLVHALRMGWTKTRRQLADDRRRNKELKFYDLWGSGAQEEAPRSLQRHIPAPRRPPPSHAESYNPPPEYLLDDKEVPALCTHRYPLTIRPEELVPQLPAPRDLQPFPTGEVLQFRGHAGLVRSADFDPAGQYVVSGGDDGTVRIWEASSGRCLRTVELGEPVRLVEWTPVGGLTLVGAAAGRRLLLLNPGGHVGAHRAAQRTDLLLAEPPPAHDVRMDERTAGCVQWEEVDAAQWARGVRVAVAHFKPVQHFSWHARGDYVVATLEEGASRGVVVHQLSRRRSQLPFRRNAGRLQCAAFHPHRPLLFVVTQRAVRVYDLVKQELVRKLLAGAQWLSALALHPAGDNLLLASYDRKCIWFDLELSSRPYQTLRLHAGAVRSVAFHRRYPLFASAGDDTNIVVCHGCVYNDLLQNPLLVPLKQLRAPPPRDQLSVLQVRWHPAQPWLLAACADGTLRLYA
ncbi:PREDICTED: ribosome biogenesis protein BOP1 homolog [Papilio xuthus]|uniref:Ribosome biogenesis protein BOP1 homolog n=1 Tax=Papilio xuthus TaxID=66420 RepID=A0AAJ6YZ44_PAPXU|nr:PREDICTED: ribosome biogenesis protein BOP1 homolog [Papilio xuthus]